ncbi:hypothetical protein VDG1235_2031 [Verrucomicrobiia bacterium DG1235]|nr:hypothetical protein VDG1235_2031 [Verrucomicrobiae bacterium DG1235]
MPSIAAANRKDFSKKAPSSNSLEYPNKERNTKKQTSSDRVLIATPDQRTYTLLELESLLSLSIGY